MKRYLTILILSVFSLYTGYFSASAQGQLTDSMAIDEFPSIPFLPDPLILDEGKRNIPVTNQSQWAEKRQWIHREYQHWISGSIPPHPKTFHIKILRETIEEGVKLRLVELSFGPANRGKMTVELMIPPSTTTLPVFMTQWNHRGWAQIAVRRGYIGCLYAGADGKDDTRNYNEVFPGYDFATLMKRAWGASRVIDYLYRLPEVDTLAIALAGHSRNGKQSLMAAAFDERIKAVVSSSSGTGGESTFRLSDEKFGSESLEEITRKVPHWFSPRLRLFTGREHKLPVDQNLLLSMIAPRGLLIVSAITESQGNPWGVEQSFRSAKKVYHFLHADSRIAILLRRGRHQHAARDVENFMDFFDYTFGRSRIAPENKLFYNYSFTKWKRLSGERINPGRFPIVKSTTDPLAINKMSVPAYRDSVRQKIRWLLGDKPYGVHVKAKLSLFLKRNSTYPDDYLEEVIREAADYSGNIKQMAIGPYKGLGDNLWGTLYFPDGGVIKDSVSKRLPLVIYLHEYSYATGYHRRSTSIINHFTGAGFAVLALDMSGFGTRVEEASRFYDRHPHWSIMGKMITDVRGVINDVYIRMPFIDSTKVYLTGYSLGGTIALFAAALDDRVKGVAVVSAFSSLRNNQAGTEGIKHYSHLHGLIPRLGFFEGQEDRIPIDFDDILGCIAPRPLLIIAPAKDKDHPVESVRKIVSSVSALYQQNTALDKIKSEFPLTYSQFSGDMQQRIARWLKEDGQ